MKNRIPSLEDYSSMNEANDTEIIAELNKIRLETFNPTWIAEIFDIFKDAETKINDKLADFKGDIIKESFAKIIVDGLKNSSVKNGNVSFDTVGTKRELIAKKDQLKDTIK